MVANNFPTAVLLFCIAYLNDVESQGGLICFNRDSTRLLEKRNETVNGNPCMTWKEGAATAEPETFYKVKDYSLLEDNLCREMQEQELKYMGPACFVQAEKDFEDSIVSVEPCFHHCKDVKRLCYWRYELPLHRTYDYVGNKDTTKDQVPCKGAWPQFLKIRNRECRYMPIISRKKDLPHAPICPTDSQTGYDECFSPCDDTLDCIPAEMALVLDYKGTQKKTMRGDGCQEKCQSLPGLPIGPVCSIAERYELCIPQCDDDAPCFGEDKGIYYSGSRDETLTGDRCVRWDDESLLSPQIINYVQRHLLSFGRMLNKLWMHFNFCRNWDNSDNGPWCYAVVEGEPRRQNCFVSCREQKEASGTIEKGNSRRWEKFLDDQKRKALEDRFTLPLWAIILIPFIIVLFLATALCACICAFCIERQCCDPTYLLIYLYRQCETCCDRCLLESYERYLDRNQPGFWREKDGTIIEYPPTEAEQALFANLKDEVGAFRQWLIQRLSAEDLIRLYEMTKSGELAQMFG